MIQLLRKSLGGFYYPIRGNYHLRLLKIGRLHIINIPRDIRVNIKILRAYPYKHLLT